MIVETIPFKSCLVLGGHYLSVHNCSLPTCVLQHQRKPDIINLAVTRARRILLVNLTLRERTYQDNIRRTDGLGAVHILYGDNPTGSLAGASPLIFV